MLSIKTFDDDLHRRAKHAALDRGIELREWVAEAFEEKLARDEAEAPR